MVAEGDPSLRWGERNFAAWYGSTKSICRWGSYLTGGRGWDNGQHIFGADGEAAGYDPRDEGVKVSGVGGARSS